MADDPKPDALMELPTVSMARPSFIPHTHEGTEEIDANEIRLPRLAIAQSVSPEMIPDSSSYIEGLKLYDLFNDLTQEIYGRGPITFIPARRDVVRIEFIPRKEGGGVRDFNVPVGDPRNDWSTDPETGERKKPKATKFVEFVIQMFRKGVNPMPIVLSIKCTNKFASRAADRLTGFIKFSDAPIYSGVYTVEAKSEKSDSGPYGVYVIKRAGFVQDKNLLDYMAVFHENLKGKQIVVDRDESMDDASDDATFDVDHDTDEVKMA